MWYREKKKRITKVEITEDRKLGITAIKEHLGCGTAEALEFYQYLLLNPLKGEDYYDNEHLLSMNIGSDKEVISIEFEEGPLSKEEIEEQQKIEAAEKWRDSLSDEEKGHIVVLARCRIPVAGGIG